MWRTVIVNNGEKLLIRNNWLIVYSNNNEHQVPIEDIYAVVIDNHSTLFSVSVMTTLAQAGVHILFCDEKHIPVAASFPLNTHYKPLSVINRQFNLTEEFKNDIWSRIVKAKIINQYKCLHYCGIEKSKLEELLKISDAITSGDKNNREAVAAKKYFKMLFGCTFKRSDNDITNAALNYGYSVVRSSVCKTLCVYGFNCVLGVHHINQSNPFNLADDIMEPLRPLVDLLVDENCDNLFETLTKENRRTLVNVVNLPVLINEKKMRVRYAIDVYVRSLVTAINENNPDLLLIPQIIPVDEFFEEDV